MCNKKFTVKATVYDKRGRVLTTGENSYSKTHPLQSKYAVMNGLDNKIFLHAEISALSKLKKHHKPYRIVVERYMKDGTPACAKPCVVCSAAIQSFNIPVVEYTE